MQRRTPAVSQGHVEDFALLVQSRMTLPSLSNLTLTLPNVNVRLLSLQPPRPIPHTIARFCTEQAQELFHRQRLISDLHFPGKHFISEIDTFSINAGVSICIGDYDTIYQHNDISQIA